MADAIEMILRDIARLAGKDGEEYELRVGVLEGATDRDGEPIVERAVGNHFGTAEAPPRPFMTWPVDKNMAAYDAGARRMLAAGADGKDVLAELGQQISMDIKRAIRDWQTPKNSDETIQNKRNPHNRRNNPLVDYGDMMKAISYEVVPRGGKGD